MMAWAGRTKINSGNSVVVVVETWPKTKTESRIHRCHRCSMIEILSELARRTSRSKNERWAVGKSEASRVEEELNG